MQRIWKTWFALAVTGAIFLAACGKERAGSLVGPDGSPEEQRHHVVIKAPIINGNDNGTNGNDNGTNGNDNGTNGNDNGTNGNDNGTNGNDNGTNGNDNGTNGNDNGTNGNDNGTNGNDNGTNGNDNGTNGNDNGGGGTCPDGTTQLYTEMGGSDDNRAEYDRHPNGCREFRVRVRDLTPYTTYDVKLEGVVVGTLRTDDDGRGELRYQGSGFPPSFPEPAEGHRVTVGPVSGTFAADCSSFNCNG